MVDVVPQRRMSYPHIIYKWQMLLPFDVVEDVKPQKLHLQQNMFMPDVIAKWQMEWPLQGGFEYQLVDVITRWEME